MLLNLSTQGALVLMDGRIGENAHQWRQNQQKESGGRNVESSGIDRSRENHPYGHKESEQCWK